MLSKIAKDFIVAALDTDDYKPVALAGDASARQYYRIVQDVRSYVLMQWEPFVDDGKYPFLSVLDHFARHGVSVPDVVLQAPIPFGSSFVSASGGGVPVSGTVRWNLGTIPAGGISQRPSRSGERG